MMYWIIGIVVAAYLGNKFVVRMHNHDLHEDARLNRLRIMGQRGDLNDHYNQ